eukprot:SAG31_NODE_2454_length_5664_cov_4.255885_10_plen_76_part_00
MLPQRSRDTVVLTAVDEPVSKALVAVVENVFAAGLQTTVAFSYTIAVVEACPDLRCLQLIMIWKAARRGMIIVSG